MWFQTPQYLRWSRMQLLKPENRQRLIEHIGIRPGDRVLDVGCGSGELIRYLAQGVCAHFVGIDLDGGLIRAAQEVTCDNAEFLQADALALPFADDSFDVVISHTFFTAIFQAESAMDQMRRVCKQGGTIASVTADSIRMLPHDPGIYPELSWVEPYRSLRTKLDIAFRAEAERCCVGVKPEGMPGFFARQALEHIRVYPIEKFYCLSNLELVQRQDCLEAEYHSDLSRMDLLSPEDQSRYVPLLKQRTQDLSQPENTIWDWSGGTNLLIVASNKKKEQAEELPDPQLWKEALIHKENIHLLPIRAHVDGIASVEIKDSSGKALYGTGLSPEGALEAAYKGLVARQYLQSGGESCPAERLITDNLPLKTCLQQLNPGIAQSDAGYLQEMAQWDDTHIADVFTASVTGQQVRLPRWITEWCYPEQTCSAARSEAEARLDSLHRVCAQYALKTILTQRQAMPLIPDEVWKQESQIQRAVSALLARGITVRFFHAHCGMDLPVAGVYAIGNGGAKIRACSAGNPSAALNGCIAALFEGCTIDTFFSVPAVITGEQPSQGQLYNVLTAGEGYFPAWLLEHAGQWQSHVWQCPHDPTANLEALQQCLTAQGWDIYVRSVSKNGVWVCQTVIPGAGLLLGRERLLEYALRKLSVPVLQSPDAFNPEQLRMAMKYVSMKQNHLRENRFGYLTGTDRSPALFGKPVDGRILMGLYDIYTGDRKAACARLPDGSMGYRCLKELLRGQSPQALELLYGQDTLRLAQTVLSEPLAVLSAEK